ncbi:hypothetical protein EVAR_83623_1 [Eumeta japonica]|uniref:Uncharacterized protein n=1 Tax=Eumeta variegata TaxID=151549 RepID=A0A4C1UPU0_EUMVA|nr:hypothetical protein EVAR_83623_1 [Eumeta japonica]
MKLVAAMSKKPSKAIFDNSDTTVSNEDIETTSEAYETLKDAEEEQNEHQDSTASLESHKVYQVPYIFGPFEPYSATDAVQDAQNKIEDSATELQRRHRSTAIQRRDHHRGIFSHHHHYDHDRNHHDRGQHRPHDDHRHVYRKHSETPQAHTDEPVPVAPTDSADAPRPSEKRKSTCNSRKRTHRIAKAKEELLRAQVQLAAARLAALETEETDSEEDENTVVQDQETQKRVGNWVDTQMETLATIDAPHQKTERRGKTAEYRRARDRCQDRHATCSLRDLDTSRVRNRTEETDRNPDSGARNRNLAYTTFST